MKLAQCCASRATKRSPTRVGDFYFVLSARPERGRRGVEGFFTLIENEPTKKHQPTKENTMNNCPYGRDCENGKFLDAFYGDKCEKPCSAIYDACHIYRKRKAEADAAKAAKTHPSNGQPSEAPIAPAGFFSHFKMTG